MGEQEHLVELLYNNYYERICIENTQEAFVVSASTSDAIVYAYYRVWITSLWLAAMDTEYYSNIHKRQPYLI